MTQALSELSMITKPTNAH